MNIKKITLEIIINELKNNAFITEKELTFKYFCHERTIRRYIKVLKEANLLKIQNSGIRKKWIFKDK